MPSSPVSASSAPAPAAKPSRIDSVDALRGSALLGLFLLHTIEHFDFMSYPKHASAWLQRANGIAHHWGSLLFGGKAYAIFAMMFGLSFFLILDRAAARGVDFRARFAWRLAVLLLTGYAFGLLYCGEILTMLALLGLPLLLLHRVPTRPLVWLSGLLLLQLPFWWRLGRLWVDPTYTVSPGRADAFYGALGPAFAEGGLLDVIKVNLWTGVQARWAWSFENGRYLQMLGLFIWGLLLGRHRVFEDSARCSRVAVRAFVVALFCLVALRVGEPFLWRLDPPKPMAAVIGSLLWSYANLVQMVLWASGFVLLYNHTPVRGLLRLLVPFGRTSLTCYITQSVVGVTLFYNFGFGLFRHWGQFYSVLYGVSFFVLQCVVATVWLRHFHYGPLEWLWRSATLLSWRTPFRRRARATAPIPTQSASEGTLVGR